MKKQILTVLAVLVLGTSLAVAGPHGGKRHGMKGGEWSEKMSEKLNLTEAQKQQIRDLQNSFRTENEPFLTSFRENRRAYTDARRAGDTAKADALKATLDAQKEQMNQLRTAQHERILSVLTAEQRAQLEAWKAERKARGPHGQHQGDQR